MDRLPRVDVTCLTLSGRLVYFLNFTLSTNYLDPPGPMRHRETEKNKTALNQQSHYIKVRSYIATAALLIVDSSVTHGDTSRISASTRHCTAIGVTAKEAAAVKTVLVKITIEVCETRAVEMIVVVD